MYFMTTIYEKGTDLGISVNTALASLIGVDKAAQMKVANEVQRKGGEG